MPIAADAAAASRKLPCELSTLWSSAEPVHRIAAMSANLRMTRIIQELHKVLQNFTDILLTDNMKINNGGWRGCYGQAMLVPDGLKLPAVMVLRNTY